MANQTFYQQGGRKNGFFSLWNPQEGRVWRGNAWNKRVGGKTKEIAEGKREGE